MFAWVPIPEDFRKLGTLAFSKLLLERANVAVAPWVGFDEYGEGFVRNRARRKQPAPAQGRRATSRASTPAATTCRNCAARSAS